MKAGSRLFGFSLANRGLRRACGCKPRAHHHPVPQIVGSAHPLARSRLAVLPHLRRWRRSRAFLALSPIGELGCFAPSMTA